MDSVEAEEEDSVEAEAVDSAEVEEADSVEAEVVQGAQTWLKAIRLRRKERFRHSRDPSWTSKGIFYA